MLSKEWKLILIAPLAAGLLSACQKDKKEEMSPSPLQGVWVNESAYKLYERKAVQQKDLFGFCTSAFSRNNREAHGVKRLNNIYSFKINALSIEANGDVRLFEATPNASTPAAGNVAVNGMYSGSDAIADRVPKSSTLHVSSTGLMTVVSLAGPEQYNVSKTYQRTDRKLVADYFNTMLQCLQIKNNSRNFDEGADGYWKPIDEGDDLPPVQGPHIEFDEDEDFDGGKDADIAFEDLEEEDLNGK